MSWRVRFNIDKAGVRGRLEVSGFATQATATRVGTAFMLALVNLLPGDGRIEKQVLEDGHGDGGADRVLVPDV